MANAAKTESLSDDNVLLTEEDLDMQKGLPALEVDRRLVSLARAHRRLESVLCFYLQEVEERQLYIKYGHSSTVDYARERLGFEDKKTRALLNMAVRLAVLPKMKEAFRKGDIPWTKAREAVRAAKPETDAEWTRKCQELSNRQIEQEVRKTLPPVRKKTLVFVLEGDLLEQWEQAREACERLAGQTLSDTRVLDLMCAEMLCTYATSPPFDPENEEDGGFARSIAERDSWICSRPGCRCRAGLTGNHIIPRSQGGPDEGRNLHLVCAACHLAITEGRLKVSGRAPDGLTWEGPFGVIEKPLPLDREPREDETSGKENDTKNSDAGAYPEPETKEDLFVREAKVEYVAASHVGQNGPDVNPSLGSKGLEPYGGLYVRLQSFPPG
jgi:hypothetical protein